jgi:hypothetical protein
MESLYSFSGQVTNTALQILTNLDRSWPLLYWNAGYAFFVFWLYLFHSPFRVHTKVRTDWYAQLTKIMQVWVGISVTLFHLAPSYIDLRRRHDTAGGADSTSGSGAPVYTVMFFPMYVVFVAFFMFVHQRKRRWQLRVTFAPTATLLFLNSLLMALFMTVHYAYCRADDFVNVTDPSSVEGLQHASFVHVWWKCVCPPPLHVQPVVSTLHLALFGMVFVLCDYQYKRLRGFDTVRGILWCEQFELEVLSSQSPRVESPVSKAAAEEQEAAHPQHPQAPAAMVPWFSTIIAQTAFQLFLGSSLNFLSFDFRTLERTMHPKVFSFVRQPGAAGHNDVDAKKTMALPNQPPAKRELGKQHLLSVDDLAAKETKKAPRKAKDVDSPEQDDDVWFDFIADVGDGFNSTYEMARLLAQPSLKVPRGGSAGRLGFLRGRLSSFIRWAPDDSRTSRPKRSASADAQRFPASPSELRSNTTPELTRSTATAVFPGSFALPSASGVETAGEEELVLPRGQFVVIGGDLAYPNPSNETYGQRLFGPYGDAMPMDRKLRETMQHSKRTMIHQLPGDPDVACVTLPRRGRESRSPDAVATPTIGNDSIDSAASTIELLRQTPLLFAIPGNHDWIDGLNTFRERIIGKSWIGSWYMPQTTSYFIIQLPQNWFLFCLDTGLFEDIDSQQLAYFFEAIETRLHADSSVILISHEPAWIHEQYRQKEQMGPKTSKLAKKLGNRLRARLCGDIHNYSRHVPVDPRSQREMLIVSGGGGAFLHGPRPNIIKYEGTTFRRAAAFPARNDFLTIATRLFGFRIVNWQFDLIGGILYFVTIASMLPLPFTEAYHPVDRGLIASSLSLSFELVAYIFAESVFSCVICVALTIIFIVIMEDKLAPWKRVVLGVFWSWLHIVAAVFLLSLLHTAAISMHRSKFVVSTNETWGSMMDLQLASSAGELVENIKSLLPANISVAHSLLDVLHTDSWYHTSPAAVGRTIVKVLDVLEGLIYFFIRVSSDRIGHFAPGISRFDIILYYGHMLWFYWLLATPVVSIIVGLFLMVSITLFDTAYDPAYSAFQIEDYKHFLRFKLSPRGTMHVFVIGLRKVHKVWERDPQHAREHDECPGLWPFLRRFPSLWRPVPDADSRKDCAPRLIEQFSIPQTPPARSSRCQEKTA